MPDWPEIARCFAVLRPVRWLDPEAGSFLAETNPRRPVILACSGGADSVFLLLSALDFLEKDRIHVAHFHHGLRGREADRDASFVEHLCQALGLGFSCGRRQPAGDHSEAALRTARYAWLGQLYKDEQAEALLLGHHADDLLETQLIGLLTGCGPAGMCAPLPVHRFPDGHVRVRPLLSMKRSTIEKTLSSLGAPWRNDGSNKDLRYTRNWIRNDLVPFLSGRFPQDIHAGSARTCKLQREAVEAVDAAVIRLQLNFDDPMGFDARSLYACPDAVIRRALYAWWMRHRADHILPTKATDKLVQTLSQGRVGAVVSIGKVFADDASVYSIAIDESGQVRLTGRQQVPATPWRTGCHWHWRAGPLVLPTGSSICGEPISWAAGQTPYLRANPATEAWLRPQSGPLHIRQWCPGDRYQPLGAPGRRKLQDIFCDAKLNSEQKQALPVILNSADEILWVPGFPPAESARIPVGTKSALRLTYRMHSTALL